MVSKIKGPRNYLSCCHVLTAMGRGQRGTIPERKLGLPGPRHTLGTPPQPQPQPQPQASATHGPRPPPPRTWPGRQGWQEHDQGLLGIYPQIPSRLWEGGVLPFSSLLRVSGGWGLGHSRESGCLPLPSPFAEVAGDSQTPNSRVKARSKGR